MASEQPVVASAVVVPEALEPSSPQNNGLKRRQSSISEADNKRPRLSVDGDIETNRNGTSPAPATDRRADRRKSGQAEERKRGQRLFGALLGTLSQSSSSAAQKRRADIEKKQQAKLKLQAEEFDQKQKKRLDELMAVRRREQKKFDEQSMRIRHSNLLAMAHFLRTTTEPMLYYKPWELRPEDEVRIRTQVEEAEAQVDRELEDFQRQQDEEEQEQQRESVSLENMDIDLQPTESSKTVGSEPSEDSQKVREQKGDTNHAELPPDRSVDGDDRQERSGINGDGAGPEAATNGDDTTNKEEEKQRADEAGKGHTDDNGEVILETEEDTVIY